MPSGHEQTRFHLGTQDIDALEISYIDTFLTVLKKKNYFQYVLGQKVKNKNLNANKSSDTSINFDDDEDAVMDLNHRKQEKKKVIFFFSDFLAILLL